MRNKIKRIIVVIISLAVIMTTMVKPVKVKAFDLVLTPAIITYIATALLSCGITFADELELDKAVEYVWNHCTDEQKMWLSAPKTFMNASGALIAQFARTEWDGIKTIWYEIFGAPEAIIENPVAKITITPFGDVADLTQFAGRLNLAPFVKEVNVNELAQFEMGNTKISVIVNASSNILKIEFPDYTLTSNLSYGYENTGKTYDCVRLLYPEIEDYNKLSIIAIMLNKATGEYIQIHNSISSMYYEKGTLKSNTRLVGRLVKVNDITLHDLSSRGIVNDYNYIGQWNYDDVLKNAITINPVIEVDYYPDAGVYSPDSVTTDGTEDVTLRIPATTSQVVELAPADVIVTDYTTTIPADITTTPDTEINKYKAPAFILTKFPFCIPYDIYNAVAIMSAEPKAPRFEIPFKIDSLNFEYNMVIDFKELGMDTLAEIVRWFLAAAFTLGLIIITRNVIKG